METLLMLKQPKFTLLTIALMILGSANAWSQTTNVWPGDINENGVVNHVDLLYLGLRLGEQGPARDSVSIEWIGHSATRWAPSLTTLPDPVHADCDGDSTVELSDRAAIDLNYGWDKGFELPDSSSLSRSGVSTAPLSFDFSSAPLVSGTTDTIYIYLGTPDQAVDSLLGFATTITFDSTLVDSAYLFVGNSWLGTEGTDLTAIDHYEAGVLNIAMTRTDLTDAREGHGLIGGIVVVMTDNLKREVQVDSMGFQFADALGLTSRFGIAAFEVSQVSAKVFSTVYPLDALIYPVPTSDGLNITLLSPLEGEVAGSLYDFRGTLVKEFSIHETNYRINRDGISSGIYYLQLRYGGNWLRKRVVFVD